MTSRTAAMFVIGLLMTNTAFAESPTINRKIGKEPIYQTKTPQYGLLAFGPEGKDRVWMVRDGETLYVDRNGNGDLTEPGEKIAADKRPGQDPEDGCSFDVGDLVVGGRTHKGLRVIFTALKLYAGGELGKRADVKAILAKEPTAFAVSLAVDVDVPGMKGGGIGHRPNFQAGPVDINGVFQFADKPADAPVVRLGGPLEVTFYAERPTLRVGRTAEFVLVVGTSGIGPGTFAMLGYEDAIPNDVKPVAEFWLVGAKVDSPVVREKYEIKGRC